MSFRARLTSFFVLIVVVPMVAVAFLVFRLISDSEQGKVDARANGLATAAASLYASESAAARADAQAIAHDSRLFGGGALDAKLRALISQAGLARASVSVGAKTLADVGDRSAIAPGVADVVSGASAPLRVVRASELTATQYARDLAAPGVGLVVSQHGRILTSSSAAARERVLPVQGTVTLGGVNYRTVALTLPGFDGSPLTVTVLSSLSATTAETGASRVVAVAFIAGFLLLALSFSVLSSRALQAQLGRFLQAARRLAAGDFSSPVPVHGRDEFAALGGEFNNMSDQLARRLDELQQERARLRASIRRIGQTLASKLDRPALLELALKTAVDAVEASCGRLTLQPQGNEQPSECVQEGSLEPPEDAIRRAEEAALRSRQDGEAESDGFNVASVPLVALESEDGALGVLTVARGGRPFSGQDRDVLRTLAAQTTLALENVELHFQVRRQAVTDELTGLVNHRRFQEVLGSEMEQVRRYEYPVGLIMLDIDNFKSINDTHGHPQGDVVLRQVARVLCDTSRDADTPARYGGEEMALILPHTEIEGSYAIAERVRIAVEGLRIPKTDGDGMLRITASVGVAASAEGDKGALIADADGALYEAKRRGKNRTLRAPGRATQLFRAE